MTNLKWGFWLAFFALIAAFGKFLDEYHIDSELKEKLRKKIIIYLAFIEKPKIPDIGKYLAVKISNLFSSHFKKIYLLLIPILYLFLISGFYLVRKSFENNFKILYWDYLRTWFNKDALYWFLISSAIIFCNIISIKYMFPIIRKMDNSSSLVKHFIISIKALFYMLIISIVLSLLFAGFIGGYGFVVAFLIPPLLCYPFIILALFILFFVILKMALEFSRFILASIFKAASLPKNSPFLYMTTLIGILGLFSKVIQELIDHQVK